MLEEILTAFTWKCGRSGSLNYDSGSRNYIFIRYKREKASKQEAKSQESGFINWLKRLLGMK